MTRFCAVIVLCSLAEGKDPLYQENIVLLDADSLESARARAAQHGRDGETEYRNGDGELVRWRLAEVVDVAEVPDQQLGDGAEVYTRHFRDYAAYRRFEPLLDGEPL
ncbi:DUF4288 domain-containing protein [Crossiella sp. CA-258035]|uniref:DUF4288 domain-containing protein n=1 Tax=Crossiella sp. CA-258035 TaxID=2981138 RepID=UPI0024BCE63D|nr:DUF4288 domain-containing protein [Crossiella sp. CA-258035]WHT18663.1 DUF4288 domain-containing protein [Crossiella sp. CA-258035]